nr:hypothetical protein [Desulfobulbaceae bacterium]
MGYDSEKYRDKRDKVLGVKNRGVSFGTLATVVSAIIILGLGAIVVPKTIGYLTTRNLDDAIYKMADSSAWHQEIVQGVDGLHGVRKAMADHRETRLVVTFNRLKTNTKTIDSFFKDKGLAVDLLNTTGHRQRQSTLKKEAEFEAL